MMISLVDSTTGKLVLIHGFARYVDNPGRSSPDHHAHFCFEGCVSGQDIMTVAVDHAQMGFAPYVNVPRMLDRHHSLLEGDNSKAVVGTFADHEAVHTVCSRIAMFVPYELVKVLLGGDLSSREAFLVSYPLLEDADLLDVCRPFLEFLQVASTVWMDE
jgi:hypothetical protein